MKKDLIKSYIDKLEKNDIKKYLSKEFITYNDNEIDTLYNIIKKDYEEILNSNFIEYISKYENTFNNELYKKIIEKYNEYKKFIE